MPTTDLRQKMFLRAGTILINGLPKAELFMENVLSWNFIEFFFYPDKDNLQLNIFK